jgi:simple sugar transport system permease protein
MWLKLEQRQEPSSLMRYLSPVIAVGLMLVGGTFLFYFLGKSPLDGFRAFFINPIQSQYGISELFLKATPLMLCAVGISVGFRANVWNIGAEGQFLIGALAAGAVALKFPESNSPFLLPGMILAGAIGGILWAAIPAWLRTRFGANEILTSLMLVYVAQLVVLWLVHGPWKDPCGHNFPQTELFQINAELPTIVTDMRVNIALIFAIVALIIGWVFMNKSFIGYQMKVAGQAEHAGCYAGFNSKLVIWLGMLIGGGMAGIAGMSEVAGPIGQINEHISSGYGFTAIIVAFVGRLHPVGIFFSSLLLALLCLGGEQAQQFLNLPPSISSVFQGMLLFFLLTSDVFIEFRPRLVWWNK